MDAPARVERAMRGLNKEVSESLKLMEYSFKAIQNSESCRDPLTQACEDQYEQMEVKELREQLQHLKEELDALKSKMRQQDKQLEEARKNQVQPGLRKEYAELERKARQRAEASRLLSTIRGQAMPRVYVECGSQYRAQMLKLFLQPFKTALNSVTSGVTFVYSPEALKTLKENDVYIYIAVATSQRPDVGRGVLDYQQNGSGHLTKKRIGCKHRILIALYPQAGNVTEDIELDFRSGFYMDSPDQYRPFACKLVTDLNITTERVKFNRDSLSRLKLRIEQMVDDEVLHRGGYDMTAGRRVFLHADCQYHGHLKPLVTWLREKLGDRVHEILLDDCYRPGKFRRGKDVYVRVTVGHAVGRADVSNHTLTQAFCDLPVEQQPSHRILMHVIRKGDGDNVANTLELQDVRSGFDVDGDFVPCALKFVLDFVTYEVHECSVNECNINTLKVNLSYY